MRLTASVFALAFVSPIGFAQQPAAPAAPPPQPAEAEQVQQPPPAPPPHVALRIVGSHVRNAGGDKLGRIEEVLVNRTNGAVEYAVLAPNFPTNDSRLVPVPWSILRHAWDQSLAGGPAGANQVFIANLDPSYLAKAPTLDRTRPMGIDPALEAANNYFASGTGGTGSGAGTVTGGGSGQPAATPGATVAPQPGVADGTIADPGQPAFIPPVGVPGFFVVDTNAPPQFPTNGTNVGGAPITGGTNIPPRVPFQPGAGLPFTPFPGGTNSQVPRVDPGPDNDLRRDDFSVGRPGSGSGAEPLRPRPPVSRPAASPQQPSAPPQQPTAPPPPQQPSPAPQQPRPAPSAPPAAAPNR